MYTCNYNKLFYLLTTYLYIYNTNLSTLTLKRTSTVPTGMCVGTCLNERNTGYLLTIFYFFFAVHLKSRGKQI